MGLLASIAVEHGGHLVLIVAFFNYVIAINFKKIIICELKLKI